MFGAMWGSFGSITGPNGQQGFYPGQGGMMYPGGGMMYPGGGYPPYRKSDFESNGDLIYYTGYNESGSLIKIEYGPRWLYVHGGSCVNCHGTDGKGGFPVMMGFAVPSDIRYETLTSEEHEEEGEEEHPPYTDETIKRAIREGIDPAGEPLDLTMPRWDMSDSDLNDLLEYLKTL
ncbi:cytochrome c [Methanosarcina sp. KYL-1]|nr:cytochrome c [Methanosarcina sp. KYL-1]